jgi:hypothetical protein
MKKSLALVALVVTLILGWCSTSKDVSVKDCLGDADRVWCVVNSIESISDSFTRDCVQNNVMGNTGMVSAMTTGSFTNGQIADIDGLVRECIGFKTANPTTYNQGWTPMFNTFLASAGGMFLGSYLANSFLWVGRYNYNAPISTQQSSAYYSNYNRQEEEKRRRGSSAPVTRFAGSTRSVSTSKWTLGGSAKSWSSVSSMG